MGMEYACQYGSWTLLGGFHLMHVDVVDTWAHIKALVVEIGLSPIYLLVKYPYLPFP